LLRNKVFLMVVAIMIAITLILTAAFVLWTTMDNSRQAPQTTAYNSVDGGQWGKPVPAEQAKENTVELKEIMTNLAGGQKYIRVSFAFELENKKAKEEFEKLDFKMKAIIIQTLADMTSEQVSGSQGFDALTSALMNKMNPLLQEGKLRQVYITDHVIQ